MGIRQVSIIGSLCMGLCWASWIGMAYSGVDVLSPQFDQANPSVAAQLPALPLQFVGKQGEVEGQVKRLAGERGNTPGVMSTESVKVLSQQDTILPTDDRNEEFIMALSFASTQPDETTRVGNLPVFDPFVNTRPSTILFEVVNEMRVRLK